jgi:hypothetical protein
LQKAIASRQKDDPLLVDDRTLPRAIDAMWAYHHGVKDAHFGNALDGMWRLAGFDEQLEILFTPNRHPPSNANASMPPQCVFCASPDPLRRGVRWRNVVVMPNRFPYFPLSSRHVILAATNHVGQHTSSQVIASMIDYQSIAARSQPLTLFFNGKASNSQFHHHWQACREVPPLDRLLDSAQLPTHTWVRCEHGALQSFDQRNLRGMLIQGSKLFVTFVGASLARRLEDDPAVAGKYHLVLLPRQDNDVRLVVIARHANKLSCKEPGLQDMTLGALDCVGMCTYCHPTLPAQMPAEGFGRAITRFARVSIVPAEQLPWLPEFCVKLRGFLRLLGPRTELSV